MRDANGSKGNTNGGEADATAAGAEVSPSPSSMSSSFCFLVFATDAIPAETELLPLLIAALPSTLPACI